MKDYRIWPGLWRMGLHVREQALEEEEEYWHSRREEGKEHSGQRGVT